MCVIGIYGGKMKKFKNIIIYLSILFITTLSLFSFCNITSFADVPNAQKAVSHNGAWTGYLFDYSLLGKYFTIQDTTGIPVSTELNPKYFYTDDNITFYALQGKDLYTAILNRAIGIVTTSSYLETLWNSFVANIKVKDGSALLYVQGGLYDSNNNFLGYCVNDISGCYYYQPNPADTPAIDVPGELTNDVYNHYKYFTNDVYPDYITVYPPSINYMNNQSFNSSFNDNVTVEYNNAFHNLLNNLNNNYVYFTSGWKQNKSWWIQNRIYTRDINSIHFVYGGNNFNNWDNFCNYFNLSKNDCSLLFTEFYDNYLSTGLNISISTRDSNNNSIQVLEDCYIYDRTLKEFIIYQSTPSLFRIGNVSIYHSDGLNMSSQVDLDTLGFGHYYTIYKSDEVYNNIRNKNYSPNSYSSDIFLNYDPTSDNSFQISYNNIDNSTNINQDIYEDSHDYFEDNTNNNTINNQEINNNTTNIINNYYDNDNGDSDNPTGPDQGEDEDSILDSILQALKRFFEIIGKLLGTVLAGLLEVIDALLESIVGIMDNLTGITDFIGTLFSWIPSPVPQILGIGISICILTAIIKFIRG